MFNIVRECVAAARTEYVERHVHRSTVEVCPGVFPELRGVLAPEESQEDGLHNVLCVFWIASHRAGRSIDHRRVLPEDLFEIRAARFATQVGHRGC